MARGLQCIEDTHDPANTQLEALGLLEWVTDGQGWNQCKENGLFNLDKRQPG